MVLTAKRRHGWVTLAAFLIALALPFVAERHLLTEDDPDCSGPRFTGHTRIQFEPVVPADHGTHCPFCHWQRSVGGSSPSASGIATAWQRAGDPPRIGSAAPHAGPSLTARASRAPPAIV